MQNFSDELNINIFKYVNHPLNLALTCRSWSSIVKDPYAKIVWLLVKYGKAHALFHAVRLGPTFIDVAVCQYFISRETSRCYIGRMVMHFGKYNQKLINPKLKRNVGQLNARAFQRKSHWTNNLLPMLAYLLNEHQLANDNKSLPSKGNEMELFHPFSAGPVNAFKMLKRSLKDTKDEGFTLFRPKPRSPQLKNFNRGQHIKSKRNTNRVHKKPIQPNMQAFTQDTLARIKDLPRQNVNNDQQIHQFYNGFSFYD